MTASSPTSLFDSIPVLNYHDINSRFRIGITRVTPSAFQRQMEWLSNAGYQSIPLAEIPSPTGDNRKFFSITFDDAYRDLNHTALPVLQKLNFTSTLAVIAGYIGKTNRWEARLGSPTLLHLDWKQLKEWNNQGHDIASHGYSHRCLLGLSSKDLDHEIRDSKMELENRLGTKIQAFVPPFGRINLQIAEIISNQGYGIVCLNMPITLKPTGLSIVIRRSINRFDTMKSFQRKVQLGWKSKTIAAGWKITQFCSGGTIVTQRLFGNKNIP